MKHSFTLICLLAAGFRAECAAHLEVKAMPPFCPGGVVPPDKAVVRGAVEFPQREEGSICTSISQVELSADVGTRVGLEASVYGPAVSEPDGHFMAVERLNADGKRTGPRLFGYATLGRAGSATVALTVPVGPDVRSLRVLISAQRGLALGVVGVQAQAVNVAARRPNRFERRVLRDFQAKAYTGRATDWNALQTEWLELSRTGPRSTQAAVSAIRNLLGLAGMTHSVVSVRTKPLEPISLDACPPLVNVGHDAMWPAALVLTVGSFSAPASCVMPVAKSSLQSVAESLQGHSGRVVVDLRANAGGNMWPMLYALRPLLAEGALIGMKTDLARPGGVAWVSHSEAGLSLGSQLVMPTDGLPSERYERSVEVLVCRQTGSSGEAVALALRSSGAFLRGMPTAGLLTSNQLVSLPFGVDVLLTTAAIVDPSEKHSPSLKPDIQDETLCG